MPLHLSKRRAQIMFLGSFTCSWLVCQTYSSCSVQTKIPSMKTTEFRSLGLWIFWKLHSGLHCWLTPDNLLESSVLVIPLLWSPQRDQCQWHPAHDLSTLLVCGLNIYFAPVAWTFRPWWKLKKLADCRFFTCHGSHVQNANSNGISLSMLKGVGNIIIFFTTFSSAYFTNHKKNESVFPLA